jgi:hypothetical protein
LIGKHFDPYGLSGAQGFGIERIDFSGWCEPVGIEALYQEEDDRSPAVPDKSGQLLQVLGAAGGYRIGEEGAAVFHVGTILHFDIGVDAVAQGYQIEPVAG